MKYVGEVDYTCAMYNILQNVCSKTINFNFM